MWMKFIITIILILIISQVFSNPNEKKNLHWTQKIFIKEKKNLELKENDNYKCKNLFKENDPNIKREKKLSKNECNEKNN